MGNFSRKILGHEREFPILSFSVKKGCRMAFPNILGFLFPPVNYAPMGSKLKSGEVKAGDNF